MVTYIKNPTVWLSYIDDILCLWDGPTEELATALKELNTFYQNKKFTEKFQTHRPSFLTYTSQRHEISENTTS